MKNIETPSRVTDQAEIIIGQRVEGGKIVDETVHVRLTGDKVHVLACVNGTPTDRGVEQDGIVLPDSAANRCWWYKILAVAPGCKYYKPEHVGGKIKLTDNGMIGNCWVVGPAERIFREKWLESRKDNPFCVVMED